MADQNLSTTDKAWHLDRRVPLALIFTIVAVTVGQAVAYAYWTGGMDWRVKTLESKVAEAVAIAAPRGDRLTRVEVKIETIQHGVERIEGLLRIKGGPR